MSNIQKGFVNNTMTDEVDAEVLRYYNGEEGLVVAARTTEGFITYHVDGGVRALSKDEMDLDTLQKIRQSVADLAFVVTDASNDVHIVEIDADGYERTDSPFVFSDIWEVTYDDVEEFRENFPEDLFTEFGM